MAPLRRRLALPPKHTSSKPNWDSVNPIVQVSELASEVSRSDKGPTAD